MKILFSNIISISIVISLLSCAGKSMDEDAVGATEPTKSAISIPEETFLELAEKDNIELTSEQKEAFEVRAIQKLNDFLDYINIISDAEVDSSLRKHSIQLSAELFIHDSVQIAPILSTDTTESISLIAFLNKVKWSRKPIFLKASSAEFIAPINRDTTTKYTGSMEVFIVSKGKKTGHNINVHVIQVEKDFGDNNQRVFEVRLGNIY